MPRCSFFQAKLLEASQITQNWMHNNNQNQHQHHRAASRDRDQGRAYRRQINGLFKVIYTYAEHFSLS